jgi:hypothetical protein
MKRPQNGAVENYLWGVLGLVVVVAVIRPLLWWVLLSLSLWIGRKTLSPKWGKRVFGHWWNQKRVDPTYW